MVAPELQPGSLHLELLLMTPLRLPPSCLPPLSSTAQIFRTCIRVGRLTAALKLGNDFESNTVSSGIYFAHKNLVKHLSHE